MLGRGRYVIGSVSFGSVTAKICCAISLYGNFFGLLMGQGFVGIHREGAHQGNDDAKRQPIALWKGELFGDIIRALKFPLSSSYNYCDTTCNQNDEDPNKENYNFYDHMIFVIVLLMWVDN